MYNVLTFNLTNTAVRHEQLQGRSYLVAPLVMLTEGVHKGSGGPLLYKADECSRAVASWNMKPIVVYHPELNGQGISVCDPVILEKQQIGILMNTRWDGKLRSEAWIEEDRARVVDNRVLKALETNKLMEVSTGVYVDKSGEPGEWNGEAYDAIATNHQPDHLALLPDKVGACSIADGAGLLQLNDTAKSVGLDLTGMFAKQIDIMRHAVANAMSHSDIYNVLSDAIKKKVGNTSGVGLWIMDVYNDVFVYRNETEDQLYKLGYTRKDGSVELVGEPEKVFRVIEYRTSNGTLVGNAAVTKTEGGNDYPAPAYAYVPDPNTPSTWKLRLWETPEKKETAAQVGRAIAAIGKGFRGNKVQIPASDMKSVKAKIRAAWKRTNLDKKEGDMPRVLMNERRVTMTKEELVTALIANKRTQWSEDDRDSLIALEEDVLEKMVPVEEPEGKEEEEGTELPATEPPPSTENMTMEQYVAAAPPEYRDVLTNGLAAHRAQKDALIATVLANKANPFSKEFLQTKGLQELQGLAVLAKTSTSQQQEPSNVIPMFLGAATPLGPAVSDEEPLVPPMMNFANEG